MRSTLLVPILLVLVAAVGSCSSSPSSLSASAAFASALATMRSTRVLNLAVEDTAKSGQPETSEVLESNQAAYLQSVVGGIRSELVAFGNAGWERTPATGGQWVSLPIEQVGSMIIALNVLAEAQCLQQEHGRLRSLGTKEFAQQQLRAIADDGSGAGNIQGTWYLTQAAPVHIVGFQGMVPRGSAVPGNCGTPGPGSIERLYSYNSTSPVTIPPGVPSPPAAADIPKSPTTTS